jgi:hypothetical protein
MYISVSSNYRFKIVSVKVKAPDTAQILGDGTKPDADTRYSRAPLSTDSVSTVYRGPKKI